MRGLPLPGPSTPSADDTILRPLAFGLTVFLLAYTAIIALELLLRHTI